MERFNKEVQLPDDLVKSFDTYFEYRWKHNKSQMLDTKSDQDLYSELPSEV